MHLNHLHNLRLTIYAQIDKEIYAIIFGCKRFRHYIYGRGVRVETDHKPLILYNKKPLHVAPPGMQECLFNYRDMM